MVNFGICHLLESQLEGILITKSYFTMPRSHVRDIKTWGDE